MTDQSLQIAALLCSRLCHDLISPIGAIANGLEVMRDEDDAQMRETALSLIEASAQNATARLQYARLAFGVAGSMGAEVEFGDAQRLAEDLLARSKVTLDWQVQGASAPKDTVKLLLNLILVAIDCVPRGGTVTLTGDRTALDIAARGPKARLAGDVKAALFGETQLDDLDSRQVQPGFTGLLASAHNARLSVSEETDAVLFHAAFPPAAAA